MNKKNVQQKVEKSKEKAVNSPLLVSLKEAAEKLSVSIRTVRRLSYAGTLPPIVKVGGSAKMSYQGIIDYYNRLIGNSED